MVGCHPVRALYLPLENPERYCRGGRYFSNLPLSYWMDSSDILPTTNHRLFQISQSDYDISHFGHYMQPFRIPNVFYHLVRHDIGDSKCLD